MSEQLKLEVDVKNKISEKLAWQLGDWECLYPFFEGPEWTKLKGQLREDMPKISTNIENWFKAYMLCKFDNLKVVFLGLCPYHTIDPYTKELVADGLAFSTNTKHSVPPSLFKVYKAMEADLWDRMNLQMERCNNLSFLAEQGVLLTNVALTTIVGTAAYHTNVWKPFTKFMIETLNKGKKDILFVGFGQVANEMLQLVDRNVHEVIELEHPAASAYEHREWKHEKVFSRINDYLIKHKKEPILWDKYLADTEVPF